MIESLLANDVFAGVFGAGVVGAVVYQARAVLSLAWAALVRRFTCEMTVHTGDGTFAYINEWIARRPEADRIRRLQLSESHDPGHWALSVGEGPHLFLARRPFLMVSRTVEGTASLIPRQSLSVRTLGGGQGALRKIIEESMQISKGDGHTEVHLWYSKGSYWTLAGKDRARTFSSVVLPGGQAEEILEDARRFFSSCGWYAERGVPWRRGYLFYGPPGTGKTSTVHALAGELGRNIYVVNLNSLENDSALLHCFSCVPVDAILLLEDIDAAASSRSQVVNGEEVQGISLSGLLNALDGVAAGSGRLLVMTTNYPERLDSALTRAGRVDVKHCFGFFGREEVDRMVHRFHPNMRLRGLPDKLEVQPAALQEVLMSSRATTLAERSSLERRIVDLSP